MNFYDLSAEQQRAVEILDRDVSISAGAGSGKTRVLVSRFCRIVHEGLADVDQILTVTFTEKAALEMKERMAEKFHQLHQATGDPRLEAAARRIELTYIGTIHGFAARVLRENAFEAKIDPRFGVLSEIETLTLKNKVIEDLFARGQIRGTREYVDLGLAYGRDDAVKAVKKIHAHLCSLGRTAAELEIVAPHLAPPRRSAETFIKLAEELLAEFQSGKISGKLSGYLENFSPAFLGLKEKMLAACRRFEQGGQADYACNFAWDDFEELVSAANFVPGGVGAAQIKEDFIIPAKEAAEAFRLALLAPVADDYLRCLRRIVADFSDRYTEVKREMGAVDFDDLLLLARDLFIDADGSPTQVAGRYRNRFKFVMVDEFQDTNELQLSIIKAVCPTDRFFTVGDAKQSIYSFMHSDISVFQRHHHGIAKQGYAFSLAENYRTRPEMIDFVNWFFTELWREDEDFVFEALAAVGKFSARRGPHVELMVVEPGAGAERARLDEAAAIAARIKGLLGLDGGKPLLIRDKKDPKGGPRPLRPGDIIILFRATTDIKLYERALSEAGLDYYVVSGRGFYKTHEVADLLNVLRVIDNPLDDTAMAAVLRCPMVSISDDGLYWLTRERSEGHAAAAARRGQGKLFRALEGLAEVKELSEEDRLRLEEWGRAIKRLHAIRSESKIARLIETAVEFTKYDLKLLATDDGRRRFANLRKFLQVAEDFSGRGLFWLSDFIGHIEEMMVVGDREGEAPTETEESPVIRLMTVHKAKGLEAPVVIVADCARGLSTGDSGPFIVDKDQGLAAKVRSPVTGKSLPTAAYELVAGRIKQKDREEAKRLLYVAATRAEELLILSGASELKGKAQKKSTYLEVSSWLGWLERGLVLTEKAAADELLAAGDAELILRRPDKGRAPIALETGAGFFAGGPAPGELIPGVAPAAELTRFFARPPAGRTPVTLGVVEAVDFLICPQRYRCRWLLGLEEPPPAGRPVSQSGGVSAAAVGNAVHEVLASVDWRGDLEAQLEEYIALQDPAKREKIGAACAKLMESIWPSRWRESGQVFKELPFSATLPGCRLVGRIDLLFKEGDEWIVADYKTGSGLDSPGYDNQLLLYALALKKAVDVQPGAAFLIALGEGKDLSRAITDEALAETEERLVDAAARIKRLDFTTAPAEICRECGYAARVCPVAAPELALS